MRHVFFSNKELISIEGTTPVVEALELMREREIHHLLVVRNDEVLGVVSDRDILAKAFDQETLKLNARLPVSHVMVAPIPVLPEDVSVQAALDAMEKYDVSALPVITDKGLTIVTETDFLKLLATCWGTSPDPERQGMEVALANPMMQQLLRVLDSLGI